MDEEFSATLQRYRPLKEAGGIARDIYAQARADGYKIIEAMRMVTHLFGLSVEEAKQIKKQVDGFGSGMLPMESEEQLCAVLRQELYCEEEAILLLRDVLQCLQNRDYKKGQAEQQQALQSLLQRLNYEQNRGLAAWFMHLLYQRNVIYDGFIDGFYPQFCRIAPKGEWILDGIQRLYQISVEKQK